MLIYFIIIYKIVVYVQAKLNFLNNIKNTIINIIIRNNKKVN